MSARTLNVSGQSETEKLIETVNRLGLKQAAKQYGTNASSLSRWIRSQGYQLRRVYTLTPAGKQAIHSELDYWLGEEVATQMRQEYALETGVQS